MNYCAVEDGLVVEGGRGSLKAGKKNTQKYWHSAWMKSAEGVRVKVKSKSDITVRN